MTPKIRYKLLFYPLLISMIALGAGCKNSTDTHNEKAEMADIEEHSHQELDRPAGQKRAMGKGRQAVGRGQGRKGAGRKSRAWEPSDIIELTSEEEKAIELDTVFAARKSIKSQLQALGKVFAHPRKKAIVSYAFSARIAGIHIRIGDWVKTGQELITLQSEEVGTAKSEFYKSKADFELAKVNFERQKRLFDRGVGAQKDYLSSEAGFKVAQANLDAAEKKLHVLGFTEGQVKQIADSHQINPIITLYAPISGKIIENNAILGAMIDQSNEILTILDPHILVIDADIYEKDIAKIRNGQEVQVFVPAYPGENFGGKIIYISDVLKEDTRTITVRTEVENREFKLKPGMFADIKIFLNHQDEALVLPKEAILDDGDDHIVFIKGEGKYYPQFVVLGVSEDSYVEIIRGVSEGDEVVTRGNFQLKSKLYDEVLKKGHVH